MKSNYILSKCIILFYCLSFFFVIDCNGENGKEDELLFFNKHHVFGTVQQDTLLKARFYFVNISKRVVQIEYVNPECSCTGYILSKKKLMPKDTAYVELRFDSKGKYGLQKIYTIMKADTYVKMYKLTIYADVFSDEK